MGKTYFVFGEVFSSNGKDKFITSDKDRKIHITGGTKEDHEKSVELAGEFSKEINKANPRNQREMAEIFKDVVRKVGS